VSEFIRFHPLLQTELSLAAASPSSTAAPLEIMPANITVWCRLSTPEEHRAALSSSTRRNLRRADRAELTFGVETSDEAWARFFELYRDTMRRRGASDYYLFPPRYFDDCRELLGDAAALLTVRRPVTAIEARAGDRGSEDADRQAGFSAEESRGASGEIVAAAFFLRSERAVHYHLGGSDSSALAERPNNLLFVGAMDWGAELGAEAMHLGGGYLAGGEDELLRFKAGFSQLRARFHMGRCIHDQAVYDQAVSAWLAAGGSDPGGYFPGYRGPVPVAGD
jgi:lipid II:glycine glycyltransferase (peptidoglycan interpeptide bridge formation enzyme)